MSVPSTIFRSLFAVLLMSPVAHAAAPPATKAADAADPVARGAYLADAAHCAACHTREGGKPFAGNLPLASPFGTMYSSNITPDVATGIGSWTEKDFEGALRRGVGKDGKYLYPSMPYIEFTKISDADVHALWAYFRSVKPVNERTRAASMKFPFNVRLGIAGWQSVYFRPGRYVDDPSQSAAWNRGAYLVQGLGHCDACHTPTNFAMAPKKGQALQGNVIDHWFAPDISGGRYSGIKTWSEPELVTYLKTGHNDRNLAAVGPMQATIDLGLSHLHDDDLGAIATYLKNQMAGNEDRAQGRKAVECRRAHQWRGGLCIELRQLPRCRRSRQGRDRAVAGGRGIGDGQGTADRDPRGVAGLRAARVRGA